MEKLIWLKFQNAYKWSPRIKCNMYAFLLCSLSSKQVSSATMTIVFPSVYFSRFFPFIRCSFLVSLHSFVLPISLLAFNLYRSWHLRRTPSRPRPAWRFFYPLHSLNFSRARSICCCFPPATYRRSTSYSPDDFQRRSSSAAV